MPDLNEYAKTLARQARVASRELAQLTGKTKTDWLLAAAAALDDRTSKLLDANQRDLQQAQQFELTSAAIDRLRLTPDRIASIVASVRQVAALPEPIGEVIEGSVRPNGLQLTRVRCPLGVVFFIYESRPNVTVDAASICVKSGNAVILRGGKEALHSNQAFHRVLRDSLVACKLPPNAVQLVETTDREVVGHFLKLHHDIDVTIPRGGKSLIERVAREATMPVIKHFDGICHVFVDRTADLQMAEDIIVNSKCQRPGVCNAAETLLVHEEIAAEFLPRAARALQAKGVELRCCAKSIGFVDRAVAATDEDFHTEYLDLILSVRIVKDLDEAVNHITEYGSAHTDAIVTSDFAAAREFTQRVDASAVMVNASTRFNDGGEFGLGAEIGISTDKFHARGPCGIREITTYKYVVLGNGQIR